MILLHIYHLNVENAEDVLEIRFIFQKLLNASQQFHIPATFSFFLPNLIDYVVLCY